MTDSQTKQCTVKVKVMADVRRLAFEGTSAIIRAIYDNLNSVAEKPLLAHMTTAEKKELARKEMELHTEPEMRRLDRIVDSQARSS